MLIVSLVLLAALLVHRLVALQVTLDAELVREEVVFLVCHFRLVHVDVDGPVSLKSNIAKKSCLIFQRRVFVIIELSTLVLDRFLFHVDGGLGASFGFALHRVEQVKRLVVLVLQQLLSVLFLQPFSGADILASSDVIVIHVALQL